MTRILSLAAPAAAAAALVAAAPAAAQESYTPQQAFASPTVAVGGKTATPLCDLGTRDTSAGQPGAVEAQAPPPTPCSQQRRVQPLRLGRARYARVTLEAPADRVLAGWYENGALRPLTAIQTGAQQWNVTLPPISGRLFLRITFEINFPTTPAYDLSTDWKLSIRRRAATAAPAPRPPVPIDDPGPPPEPAVFSDHGR
jgi:hypothetical protein